MSAATASAASARLRAAGPRSLREQLCAARSRGGPGARRRSRVLCWSWVASASAARSRAGEVAARPVSAPLSARNTTRSSDNTRPTPYLSSVSAGGERFAQPAPAAATAITHLMRRPERVCGLRRPGESGHDQDDFNPPSRRLEGNRSGGPVLAPGSHVGALLSARASRGARAWRTSAPGGRQPQRALAQPLQAKHQQQHADGDLQRGRGQPLEQQRAGHYGTICRPKTAAPARSVRPTSVVKPDGQHDCRRLEQLESDSQPGAQREESESNMPGHRA